jgi:lipopolysaccharide transport system permease protein
MEEMLTSPTETLAEARPPVPDPGPAADPVDEQPETVIERRPGWQLLNVRELWRYRELLFFLTWRDIKVRYKQTILGAAWAVLQPLATMLIFTLFIGRMAGADTGDIPYPLYVFAGLLPWTFFANAMSAAGQSIISNQNLVTKVYFPRLLIPMGATGAGLVDFCVASGMLGVLMVLYGQPPGSAIWLAPLIFLGLVVAALGMGILLSALTVAYRDFRHVVPFLVQLWMFATPTIYLNAKAVVGPRWHALLPLNPAYGLIYNFRQAVLGGPLDWSALAISAGVAVAILTAGCLYFRRVERGFADII